MYKTPYNQKISYNGITLTIKREDLIHPYISGNKFRKLKYNIQYAKENNYTTLLTFGGAYSNHILATAFAGMMHKIKTIGVIRGDEIEDELIQKNPTLKKCREFGMILHFISRESYRKKNEAQVINNLKNKFGDFYLLPEGGTNLLAVKGCQEILTEQDFLFDIVCCSVGTGGTISGLINASVKNQLILGFPALKSGFLEKDIRKFALNNKNWQLIPDYHCGGYAKINEDYITWLNDFYKQTNVPLDPLYTGKMIYGLLDMMSKKKLDNNSNILCIHTGGLQSIKGINDLLNKKKRIPIIYEKVIDFC